MEIQWMTTLSTVTGDPHRGFATGYIFEGTDPERAAIRP